MKSYRSQKINKVVVTPIEVPQLRPNQIKGYNLVPILLANIFICGIKRSGKTNVVFELIKRCIDKNTIVVVFCATHNSDENWIRIKEWLDGREQPNVFYDSILEDENGEPALVNLEESIKEKHRIREEEKHTLIDLRATSILAQTIENAIKPPTKSKVQGPEY